MERQNLMRQQQTRAGAFRDGLSFAFSLSFLGRLFFILFLYHHPSKLDSPPRRASSVPFLFSFSSLFFFLTVLFSTISCFDLFLRVLLTAVPSCRSFPLFAFFFAILVPNIERKKTTTRQHNFCFSKACQRIASSPRINAETSSTIVTFCWFFFFDSVLFDTLR